MKKEVFLHSLCGNESETPFQFLFDYALHGFGVLIGKIQLIFAMKIRLFFFSQLFCGKKCIR